MSDNTCSECGMELRHAGEFHPYLFCVLKKAGFHDPWTQFVHTVAMVGVDTTNWPKTPPLVTELGRMEVNP